MGLVWIWGLDNGGQANVPLEGGLHDASLKNTPIGSMQSRSEVLADEDETDRSSGYLFRRGEGKVLRSWRMKREPSGLAEGSLSKRR